MYLYKEGETKKREKTHLSAGTVFLFYVSPVCDPPHGQSGGARIPLRSDAGIRLRLSPALRDRRHRGVCIAENGSETVRCCPDPSALRARTLPALRRDHAVRADRFRLLSDGHLPCSFLRRHHRRSGLPAHGAVRRRGIQDRPLHGRRILGGIAGAVPVPAAVADQTGPRGPSRGLRGRAHPSACA